MKTRTTSRATKAIAAGLVLAITQVLLGGGMARASSVVATAAAAKRAVVASGYLATRGDNPVIVDGNAAKTGETIFSGQKVQTPEGVGASVYLAGLGRVDLAPSTSITLSFGESSVVARLASGCAILSAGKGVDGVVETKATTEKVNSSSIDMCVDANDGVALKGAAADSGAGAVGAQQDQTGGGNGGGGQTGGGNGGGGNGGGNGGGLGTGPAIAITTAAVGGFALLAYYKISGPGCRRGRNFSPTVPRGPNDCHD